jgi:O-antigen ligase
MSRTAVVASAAMLLVFAYRIRARAQFVAVFAILLAVSSVMPSKFYDRINAMVSGEDDTGSGRTEIWKAGIDALGDFGLVGAGLNNFTEVYKLTVASAKGIAAHNMYLMIAVELGIPGVVLLLAAIAGGLFALWRLRRSGHHSITLAVCEAIAIGMLVSAMFGDRLWSKSFWLLWILLNWSVSVESREASVAPVAPSKV